MAGKRGSIGKKSKEKIHGKGRGCQGREKQLQENTDIGNSGCSRNIIVLPQKNVSRKGGSIGNLAGRVKVSRSGKKRRKKWKRSPEKIKNNHRKPLSLVLVMAAQIELFPPQKS